MNLYLICDSALLGYTERRPRERDEKQPILLDSINPSPGEIDQSHPPPYPHHSESASSGSGSAVLPSTNTTLSFAHHQRSPSPPLSEHNSPPPFTKHNSPPPIQQTPPSPPPSTQLSPPLSPLLSGPRLLLLHSFSIAVEFSSSQRAESNNLTTTDEPPPLSTCHSRGLLHTYRPAHP